MKYLLVLCSVLVAYSSPSWTSGLPIQELPPGITHVDESSQQRMWEAYAGKGAGYQARTEHVDSAGKPRYINRLIFEQSPYLLQHAHNPVNWFAWSHEAFERAKSENKPIFLSIGYSTCHWCHVMERESFDNPAIAQILNERFVAIKVDRERRPDVDDVYMMAVRLISQQGGWPMSNFLTPEGKPFFGATYFPPDQFRAVLLRVAQVWQQRQQEVMGSAEQLAAAVIRATAAQSADGSLSEQLTTLARQQITAGFDADHGGFGAAPKFPHEPRLLYLIAYYEHTGDLEVLRMLERTLHAMAKGGIYDHVAGGFHRYATDAGWLVPHFEKMLYNQANMVRVYLGAYRLTGNPFYRRVAEQILDYVMRELTADSGGIYSATDADSEGREGQFFLWTEEELTELLGPQELTLMQDFYGVSAAGNFEGKNILNIGGSIAGIAKQNGLSEEDFLTRIDELRMKLWRHRQSRSRPLLDRKIITAWNGMMISAMAEAYQITGNALYRDAAVKAARVLLANRDEQGALLRISLDGIGSIPAKQDDYAYLAEALVSLYDATGGRDWLKDAVRLADEMTARFWDDQAKGFFLTGQDDLLFARPKSPEDNAVASGNSVAVRLLQKLAWRTGNSVYRERARQTMESFAALLENFPAGLSYMMLGLVEFYQGETGSLAYAAEGRARISSSLLQSSEDRVEIQIDVDLDEGWYAVADAPNAAMRELRISEGDRSDWRLENVDIPDGRPVDLAFDDKPLSMHGQRFAIKAAFRGQAEGKDSPPKRLSVALDLQLCNEKLCLNADSAQLEFFPDTGKLLN